VQKFSVAIAMYEKQKFHQTNPQTHLGRLHRRSESIQTEKNKRLYALRKETIERIFADAKEKHGMRWTTLRGLEKGHHAGDAYFCIHELEKTGHLALEVRWLKVSNPRFCLSIDENLQQTPKSL
jgi:Transposase DDE domain